MDGNKRELRGPYILPLDMTCRKKKSRREGSNSSPWRKKNGVRKGRLTDFLAKRKTQNKKHITRRYPEDIEGSEGLARIFSLLTSLHSSGHQSMMKKEDSGGGEEEKQTWHETTIEMPWTDRVKSRERKVRDRETRDSRETRRKEGGGRGWFKAIRFPLNLTGRTWTEGWMTIGSLFSVSVFPVFSILSGSESFPQTTKIFFPKEEGKKGMNLATERKTTNEECVSFSFSWHFFFLQGDEDRDWNDTRFGFVSIHTPLPVILIRVKN